MDNSGVPVGVALEGMKEKDAARFARDIAEGLGLPPLIARILVARGVRTSDEAGVFLKPRLDDLSDPFLLPDMDKGIARLIDAVSKGERICIWGDYDADGVSCLALMFNFLLHLGISPVVHIPTREEGYGLSIDKIGDLARQGVGLIVSLDCGASNAEEIAHARRLGMDTIVIDHHEMGAEVPPAVAVINPKRKDSLFPTRDLAACGVTFFFLLGLRRVMHKKGLIPAHINLKKELDLVTVGTVGDMVPLLGDNRILVRHGMEVMNKKPRAWLRSMLGNRLVPKGLVNEFALGFVIVPRINATGRVSRPHKSLDFLVSPDENTALGLLAELQKANSERQRLEKKIHEEIMNSLRTGGLSAKKTIVVFNEKWHAGVLGIVAQKLAEQFGKPAIVITRVNGIWKGSGRGGDGMDLFEAICSLSPLLLKYGGHKYACGISLEEGNLPLFAEAFERAVEGTIISRKRVVQIDTAAGFDELTTEAMDGLEDLGPFGIGNPRPNLLFEAAGVIAAPSGRTRITDGSNRTWYGFYATKGPFQKDNGARIIASPVVKMEMGERFIHLNIKEMAGADNNQ
ncbi:MAG: single-stranded-DNA-specific exonuclease RecJ [Syntrophorhabdaceae bacterium]|nr:single-stranded-DNA-specific exonuclease RecJ [Syntrophorhabdaceae bacterium]